MSIPQEQVRGLVDQNPSPYWSPQIAREKALLRFTQDDANVLQRDFHPEVLPKFDWYSKALQTGANTAQLNTQSAINAAQNSANGLDTSVPGGTNLAAILRALRQQESSGNYGAVNSDSGALGAYQVLPSNLAGNRGWDYEALGRNITTQQFLQSRQLQNAIVRYKFGQYLQNHGIKGALSAWYSGDPNKWNDRDPQGNYPSIHNYVLDVLRILGLA